LAANAVDEDLQPYHERLLARTAGPLLYAGFKLIRPEEETSGPGAAAEQSAGEVAPDSAADGASSPDDAADSAVDADAAGPQALYWFFFPLVAKRGAAEAANAVAWEASSSGGRATYFFRLIDPAQASQLKNPASAGSAVDAAVRRVNRGLALLNFRRRPIYLSDEELARDPRYHRYAIAARRIPELCELRASFLGRAIHNSPESWQTQVESILGKAAQ
jgi:hypothetical protein